MGNRIESMVKMATNKLELSQTVLKDAINSLEGNNYGTSLNSIQANLSNCYNQIDTLHKKLNKILEIEAAANDWVKHWSDKNNI